MTSSQTNLQTLLFDQIKGVLEQHLSLVDEMSEILNVSSDSAYRRIRCEKLLSIDEVQKLCSHYGISFDALMGFDSNTIMANTISLEDHNFSILEYLRSIIDGMKQIDVEKGHEIIYLGKDIPMMQLFHVPEIAAFKTFVWMKTFANSTAMLDQKFDLENIDQDVVSLGQEMLSFYDRIPSQEIWSEESIFSVISQIKFYWDLGCLMDKKQALLLCDKLKALMTHVYDQAEKGIKHRIGQSPVGKEDSFRLYVNDLVMADNTIFVGNETEGKVYLSHNVMNYLVINNHHFSEKTRRTLNNLIKRSTKISHVSERDRSRFFRKIFQKIDDLKAFIELD